MIDEVQWIDDQAGEWLRALCDDLREPHRVVVVGREVPRRLTRRPRPGTVRIGIEDLRFTVDEAAALTGTDPEIAAELVERTDGWPAALGLVAIGSDGDGDLDADVDVDGLPASGPLLDGLLDGLLGDDRQRLAALAIPPLLSAEVCAAIAGPGSWELLNVSGLPRRSVGRWVALSDAVRERLGRGASLTAADAARVAARYDITDAAAFLSGRGELDELAADLAERHWTEFAEVSVGELEALLGVLGEARLAGRPRILLAAARAAERRDPQARARWIDQGVGVAEPGPVANALSAEKIRDDVQSFDYSAIERAEQMLAALGADESVARGRVLLTRGIFHGLEATPESLVAAEACFTEAIGSFRLAGEQRWQSEALNRLAVMVSHHSGQIALAADQLAESLALIEPGTRQWAVGLTFYSDVLDLLGRTTEAESVCRDALAVGVRIGDETVIAMAAWSLATARAHAGDVDDTKRWLDEVERHPGTWFAEVSGQEFLAYGADLLGALGDRDGAARYRDRVAERVGAKGSQDLLDVVDGRLEAMYGDAERALELYARLDAASYATPESKWVRLLFEALSHKRLGRPHRATELIARSLDLLATRQLPDLAQRHEAVLVQMLADVWPGGAAVAAEAPYRVVLLGRFAVTRGVDVVTPAPGNPATLVKLLALRGAQTVEAAIDALWPDADVATGRARLRNLLNRIRSQSGELVARDGDSLRLTDGVVTDAGHFDEVVRVALDAPQAERPGLARLALGAYTGDLLPGDLYEDWASAPRERLRRRYLSLVDIVADEAIGRGDLDEAMRLLDAAIEREPLEERRYLVAASALRAAGHRRAAAEVVRRAVGAFNEIGLEIGDDLAELGRSLDVTVSGWDHG